MHTRRVFIYHPDERVRNIIKQTLSSHKRMVLHPAETPPTLLSMISMVPDCKLSVFLLEFNPKDERRLYREVRDACPFAEVILLVAAVHTGDAARLVENGVVYDYLIVNPFYDVYTVRIKVIRALERSQLRLRMLDLQQKLMEMKKVIEPAVNCLANDLCAGMKKGSSELKVGVTKVVERSAEKDEVSEEIEGLFGQFDSRIEEKISDFGENMVNFTSSIAGAVAGDAMKTVGETVAQTPETGEGEPQEGERVRVLVISEHSPVRDLLRLFLSSQNMEVVEETNPAESVINILGSEPERRPHVIMLDMDMKDQEGFNILGQLFKAGPLKGIPVILLTKSKTKKILKKAASYGVSGIILKPFKLNTVREKLEDALKVREKKGASPQPEKEEKDSFMVGWKKGENL